MTVYKFHYSPGVIVSTGDGRLTFTSEMLLLQMSPKQQQNLACLWEPNILEGKLDLQTPGLHKPSSGFDWKHPVKL